QVDSIRIDVVSASHFGEHVHHILLGIAHIHRCRLTSLWARYYVPALLGFNLERALPVGQEVTVLVAAHSMEGNHQRRWLGLIVSRWYEHLIRLKGIIHFRSVCLLELASF